MGMKQLGMDLVTEDKKKYHIRLEQIDGSKDLTFRLFKDEGVLMHVAEFSAAKIIPAGQYGRRSMAEDTGAMFSVEAYGILRDWVRMVWDMTR